MPFLSPNQQCQYSEGLVKDEDGNMVNEQAVRVATQYTPDPLLPPWASSASHAAEQTQRSSSVPRPIRSHGHHCTCLTR